MKTTTLYKEGVLIKLDAVCVSGSSIPLPVVNCTTGIFNSLSLLLSQVVFGMTCILHKTTQPS